MNNFTRTFGGTLFLSVSALLWSQDPSALKQRAAELKQSVAENQAKLRTYTWTESTELSLKGEVKKQTQNECRYGPDGKVVKTPIGPPPAPPEKKRGIKGKIVEKKIDEFKDYMDRFGSLIHRYVPPDPQAIQAAMQAGKVSFTPGSTTTIAIADYFKSGDKVSFTLDGATKKLQTFTVATYLDGPEDAVGVKARMSSLADGTSFVEETILTSASKQLQIKTTNFGHKK